VTRTRRLAELEIERTAQELVVAEAVARLRGIEAEISSLKAGIADKKDLAALPRTEAILRVLHQAGRSLTPTDLVHELNGAGRNEQRPVITATLNHLLQRQQVLRPSRGRYLAF
jgi:hypothetical protein